MLPSLPVCTLQPTLSAALSAPVSQEPSGPNSCLTSSLRTWETPPWHWKSTRTHTLLLRSILSVLKSEMGSWPRTLTFRTSFAVSRIPEFFGYTHLLIVDYWGFVLLTVTGICLCVPLIAFAVCLRDPVLGNEQSLPNAEQQDQDADKRPGFFSWWA